MSNNTFFLTALDPKLITIFLRRPQESMLVQSWTFSGEPIITIGRAADNHIVLHSSVVSRYHAELRYIGTQWKLISFGYNGTYLKNELITEVRAVDGMIVNLAGSGPQLQINLGFTAQIPGHKSVSRKNLVSQNKNLAKERDTFIRQQP